MIKMRIEPRYDSANSEPPDVEIKFGDSQVVIESAAPDRTIIISYEDWAALVRATPPEKLR